VPPPLWEVGRRTRGSASRRRYRGPDPDKGDACGARWREQTELGSDLYPFASHFEDINGSRVHYLDEGAGPPLILLHGNPTWSFLYRDVIAGLRDRYRCVAIDYPGFGLSHAPPGYGYTPAEHAVALIVRLDLRGATLMVQDWGGPIGFAVATRHPDRFSAFVIGNT
jgi:haloalkane dehalogenase